MPFTVARRPINIAAAIIASILVVGGATAPANAADHPTIFTFEAYRTTGAAVSYSGRYAVWNDGSQSYTSGSTNDISLNLEKYEPKFAASWNHHNKWDGFDDLALASDGSFSGTWKQYPGRKIRAVVQEFSDATATFKVIDTSSSVAIPYYGPTPVHMSKLFADKLAHGSVRIAGEASADCIVNTSTFGAVVCPITKNVYLQNKVHGKWKRVHTYKKVWTHGGALASYVVKHPKGTWFRFYIPGSKDFKKSYSKRFKATVQHSLN